MTLPPANSPAPASRKLGVAVLMGGTSSEREISLSTGRMIAGALDSDRYDVVAIDTQDLLSLEGEKPKVQGESRGEGNRVEAQQAAPHVNPAPHTEPIHNPQSTIANPEHPTPNTNHPDLVFIALHGRGGEDGSVQGMLELLNLPYTGSGILASALAMDKAMSKRLFRGAGIPVAAEIRLRSNAPVTMKTLLPQIQELLGGFPVFVKPNAEGSTVGGTLVQEPDALPDALAAAFRYDDLILIEPYLQGMEITVGVLGNTGEELMALPVVEIVPKSAFYDYESKYAEGGSDHIIPARLPDEQTRQIQQIAVLCHELLGCRGMSRVDFIVTERGPFVLEVNTIPGMTPTSLLPQAAAHAGIPFPALLDRLISLALGVGC